MNSGNLVDILTMAGIIVFGLFVIGLIVSRLYRRSTPEISFVRTGFGGLKVVMNGGALVFPVLHELIRVNMNTLRLEVRRREQDALITRDRMRVDVLAEFYVRVKPNEQAIATASQTLGYRTTEPEKLKELIEGKFVDALRAVAAEMAMTELHEQRVEFVQKVQHVVSEDLEKNGLELESVSLTGLDQTSREHFNPDNAFDAEGLTMLTEEIETRRKRRNDIERDTQIEIERKDLEAEQQSLEISREKEYAHLSQEREIEIRRASQQAEIAQEQAEKTRMAEEAKILSHRAIEEAEIEKSKIIEEQTVEKEKIIKTANINAKKAVDLSEQDKEIAIAEKSKSLSEAQREADIARANAVRAEEQVKTTRATEEANRNKEIEVISAQQDAEKEAVKLTVAAEAEKQAAEDQAEAIETLASAEARKVTIGVDAEVDAEKKRADATSATYEAEAEGKRKVNEAANTLSADQIEMQITLAKIEGLPDIIRESVKPMEQIDGIKIIQVDGLTGGSTAGSPITSTQSNLADQVVDSALRYKAQAPLVDSLLNDLGMDNAGIKGFGGIISRNSKEDSADAG